MSCCEEYNMYGHNGTWSKAINLDEQGHYFAHHYAGDRPARIIRIKYCPFCGKEL
jgi:hypothetical protein